MSQESRNTPAQNRRRRPSAKPSLPTINESESEMECEDSTQDINQESQSTPAQKKRKRSSAKPSLPTISENESKEESEDVFGSQ